MLKEVCIRDGVPLVGHVGIFILSNNKDPNKPRIMTACTVIRQDPRETGYFSGFVGIEILPDLHKDRMLDNYKVTHWAQTEREQKMEWIIIHDLPKY